VLILSRKCGESLLINNQIELKVIEISGDKVKIGIEAPKDYKILRKELGQTMENNKAAASGAMPEEMLRFIAHSKE
jgi:carbon storage regulator